MTDQEIAVNTAAIRITNRRENMEGIDVIWVLIR